MEKRFLLFLVLSMAIMTGYIALQATFAPPREEPLAEDVWQDEDPLEEPERLEPAEPRVEAPVPQAPAAKPDRRDIQAERFTLGSLAEDSPYRMLVTLNNQGAAIERIELSERDRRGRLRYRDLDDKDKTGYLGHLALSDAPEGGARVNVVGPGTPAARARAVNDTETVGLQVGDVIQSIRLVERGEQTRAETLPVLTGRTIQTVLRDRDVRPGQRIELNVERPVEDASRSLRFEVELEERPLAVVKRETHDDPDREDPYPLSMLMTLESIANGEQEVSIPRGEEEIPGLPSLYDNRWEGRLIEGAEPAVEFRFRLDEEDLQQVELSGALELVKRYRLKAVPEEHRQDRAYPGYHLDLEVEVRNLGPQDQQVAYRLNGPNNLPLEGWWYSHKVHPTKWFGGAGARDVVFHCRDHGHELVSTAQVYSEAVKKGVPYAIPSLDPPLQFRYLGVDTLYFATVLLPPEATGQPDQELPVAEVGFQKASALPVGPVDEQDRAGQRKTNVSFQVTSPVQTIPAGGAFTEQLRLFAGPKQSHLLEQYGLNELIVYGWFATIARVMTFILHMFYGLVGNYGIAIILLTVLVRACMFPISLKTAKNAQMMQLLAPEMKQITEKYKNDMEKRAKAQRELFQKHNYNPFGGCLLMFLQLPIFIGLYKGLSVDIELRQASLIPGLNWAANLAGPDMLLRWDGLLPFAFLTGYNGWLGPYLNILPLVTVALFLMHQKLFMPPATDEQTRMQQQMMKFMTLFIGILFFRVPSGLCVYFIASSLWGIAERKLLPKPPKADQAQASGKSAEKPPAKAPATKPAKADATQADAAKPAAAKSNPNGPARKETPPRKGKKRQKRK